MGIRIRSLKPSEESIQRVIVERILIEADFQKLHCRDLSGPQQAGHFYSGTKTQFSHSRELHRLTCMTVMLPKDDDKYRVSL